ncbi:MAG: DUF1080 domain-containing protein [Cytophagales bacterium]|nr:DUF1080 domain-containing protein [Cytophagales bacterium]
MKKLIPVVFILLLSCSPKEKPEVWVDLFNGKDINDWTVKIHHHEVGENFGNTFRIVDDMIQVRYDQYGDFNDQFAHLYYNKPFSKFHLKLEYQFTGELQQGAPEYTILNSGVMFHSQDPRTMLKEQNWPISVEMQFLAGLDDGKPRPTGNMCSPGTDIEYEGKVYDGHCLNSTSKTYGKDEWVQAELIVLADSLITQIINGDTVLQYSKPTMGGGIVNGFDSAIWKPGTALKSGYIALQSEGQPINFRKVKLRELK